MGKTVEPLSSKDPMWWPTSPTSCMIKTPKSKGFVMRPWISFPATMIYGGKESDLKSSGSTMHNGWRLGGAAQAGMTNSNEDFGTFDHSSGAPNVSSPIFDEDFEHFVHEDSDEP